MAISVTPAADGDAAELAAVAAATFPLACPTTVSAADIEAFITSNLSAERFADYLADPGRVVLKATLDGRIIGYTMLIRRPDVVDLDKMYVLAAHHSRGAAAALMTAGLACASDHGAASVRLGVNQNNVRAQRFYRKHGFDIVGTRTFSLGTGTQEDFVMARPL